MIVKSIIQMKIFMTKIYCLFLFLLYCKKYHKDEKFLGQVYCLFPLLYYHKKFHTNENICGANLLLVSFCFLFRKVSYEWKYLWRKFLSCSFLFIIVISVISMKIFLAQVYSLLLFVYFCKYHTNENISDANSLLVSSS